MNSAPFMTRGNIAVPGAWLINGGSGSGGGGAFPVFNSIANLSTGGNLQFNDIDDSVLLMPGFKIELWQHGNYDGSKILDKKNTTEPEQPRYYKINSLINNNATSLKLYNLSGDLIDQPTAT